MARLRFPGRPGYRFDRLGVRYGVDDHQKALDPSTKLIDNVNRGLRYFRELFGDSDEEDFEGFTLTDISKAEKHLNEVTGVISSPRRTFQLRSDDATTKQDAHTEKSADSEHKIASGEEAPSTSVSSMSSPRGLSRRKVSLKELQQKLFKRGLATPIKTSVTSKVRLLEQKKREKEKLLLQRQTEKAQKLAKKAKDQQIKKLSPKDSKNLKLKPIKIRLVSDGNGAKIVRGPGRPSIYDKEGKDIGEEQAEDESSVSTENKDDEEAQGERSEKQTRLTRQQKQKVVVVPVSKRRDKAVARQLLKKAKQGTQKRGKTQDQAKGPLEQESPKKKPHVTATPALTSPPKPKVFVLPAVSSRSSRKIIPNKRFIEDSDIYYQSPPSVRSGNSWAKQQSKTVDTTLPTHKAVAASKRQGRKSDISSPSLPKEQLSEPASTSTSPRGRKSEHVSPPLSKRQSRKSEGLPPQPKQESPRSEPAEFSGVSSPKHGQPILAPATFKPPEPPPSPAVVPTTPVHAQESPEPSTSPLILPGKRERKPSMKLIQKLTDDDALSVLNRKLENRKKIEEKKKSHMTDSHSNTQESPMKMTQSNIEQLKAAGFSDTEIKSDLNTEETELQTLQHLERNAEATKRSGQNILRKAKLQLNRKALNRSKAALARSLKREMKKEEKKLAQKKCTEQLSVKAVGFGGFRPPTMLQQSPLKLGGFGQQGLPSSQVPKFSLEPACLPTSPLLGTGLAATGSGASPPGDAFLFPKEPGTDSSTMFKETPTSTETGSTEERPAVTTSPDGRAEWGLHKKRDICAVCSVDLEELKKRGQSTSYYNVSCCAPCQWFYRRRLVQQLKDNVQFVCPNEGKCNIFMEKRMCKGCRFRRCQEVLPAPSDLTFLQKELVKMQERERKRNPRSVSVSETESELDISAAEIEREGNSAKRSPSRPKKDVGKKQRDGEEEVKDSDADGKLPEDRKRKEKKSKKIKHEGDGPSKEDKKRKEKLVKSDKKLKRKSLESEDKVGKRSPKKISEKKDESVENALQQVIHEPTVTKEVKPSEEVKDFIEMPQLQSAEVEPSTSQSATELEYHEPPDPADSSSDEYDEELAAILNSSRDSNLDFMFQAPLPVDQPQPSTSAQAASSQAPPSEPIRSPLFDFGLGPDVPLPPPGTSGGLVSPYSGSEDSDSDYSERSFEQRGPRIKHVSRQVGVALGRTATFPSHPEIRLSALSQRAKQKLWKREEKKRPGTPDSDDMSIEEIIRRARDLDDNVVHIKDRCGETRKLKALAYRGSPRTKYTQRDDDDEDFALDQVKPPRRYAVPDFMTKTGKMRKRRVRCQQCDGCRAKDCRKCVACADMVKYGGKGTMKKACIERTCLNPVMPDPSFIQQSKKGRKRELGGEDPGGGMEDGEGVPGRGPRRPRGRGQRGGWGGRRTGDSSTEGSPSKSACGLRWSVGSAGNMPGGFSDSSAYNTAGGRSGDQRHTPIAAWRSNQTAVPTPPVSIGGQHHQVLKKLDKNKVIAKERGDVVVLQSLVPASQRWAGGRDNYTIKADFRSHLDPESVWRNGVSLISSAPMCIRTVCFLCGSAGREELIYCNICCEPFHGFCLEERERPRIENLENWCCRRCQFCHVCGKQHNLLCCDKCQNTYHPQCLGPNYPAKPSRNKNVWVCMKCVKCRSCGVTSPGQQAGACWTHDFTLCYSCGHLTDKGNYCPICQKCYADDDWDCKMIQCSSCESWVHARCEGLTDEMYQVLSYLPEEVAYNCRVCLPVHPAPWEQTIRREIHAGIAAVIGTMVVSKSAQHLHILEDEEPERPAITESLKRISPPAPDPTTDPVTLLPMEELDPEVLAAAESLLQQVCEAEEAEKGAAEGRSDESAEDHSPQGLVANDPTGERTDNLVRVSPHVSGIHPSSTYEKSDSGNRVREGGLETDNRTRCSKEPTTVPVVSEDTELTVKEIPATESNTMQEGTHDCDKNSGKRQDATQTFTKSCDSRTGSNVPDLSTGTKVEETKLYVSHCSESTPVTEGGGCSKDISKDEPSITITDTDGRVELIQTRAESPMQVDESQHISPDMAGSAEISVIPMNGAKSELKGNLVKPDQPRGTHRRVVHFEDEKVDLDVVETLSGPAVSEGTQSVDDRSPSATLTADEVAQDTLSDFGDFDVHRVPDYISLSAFMPVKPLVKAASYPRDLKEVKDKVVNKQYRTVEEFNDDIVRILQFNLKRITELAPQSRRKSMKTIESLFVKTMKECFPWFSVASSRLWENNRYLPDGMLDDATVPPSEDHTYAQWLEKEQGYMSPQPSPFKRVNPSPHRKIRVPMASLDSEDGEAMPASVVVHEDGEDTRRCLLCTRVGDEETDDAGRLVYAGQDDWVHINCALWSAEVFEEVNQALQNVHAALTRGRQMKCDACMMPGATVGCCCRGCPANYHFMCARKQRCIFQEDKKVFCRNHWDMMDSELVDNNRFGILRRSCVEMNDTKFIKKQWVKGVSPNSVSVLCGSMTLENLGRLSPLSDTKAALIPVDFCSTRVYWSTVDARRRCVYTCRVLLVKPEAAKTPEVIVKDMTVIHDENHPEYDPAKVTELEEMMERQRPPPKKRKRRKSLLSISGSSSDSGDSDYIPSSEDEDDKSMPAWRRKETSLNWASNRPRGVKGSSSYRPPSEKPPLATCGSYHGAKGPLQNVMTPLPKGPGVNETPPPSVVTSTCKEPEPVKEHQITKMPASVAALSNLAALEPKPVLSSIVTRKPKTTLSDEMLERLGQELGVTDNEEEEMETSSNLNGQQPTGSFFMKTVSLGETEKVRRRRLSQESTNSESEGSLANVTEDNKALKELFSEKGATSLGEKIDVLMAYLGMSSQQGAPTLQSQLQQLQSHVAANETDQETSQQVNDLLIRVPCLLSRQTEATDSGRDSTFGKISNLINNILEKVSVKPANVNTPVHRTRSEANKSKSGENTKPSTSDKGESNVELKDVKVMLERLKPEDLVKYGSIKPKVRLERLKPEELKKYNLVGQGLTPDEVAAAEKDMLKAQVDGSNDSEEEPVQCNRKEPKVILERLTLNVLKKYNIVSQALSQPKFAAAEKLRNKAQLDGSKESNRDVIRCRRKEPRVLLERLKLGVLKKYNLIGQGLTPYELAAAENAMFKAQLDGKNDSDEDSSSGDGKGLDGVMKSYPLRRTAARAAEVSAHQQKTLAPGNRRGSMSDQRCEELPLADKIALKIKKESLARSAPSVDGPFKCPTCKRIYRTQESYLKHIKICDYYVSSDDEEEEEDLANNRGDNEWSPPKEPGEQARTMKLRDNPVRRSMRGQSQASPAENQINKSPNKNSQPTDTNSASVQPSDIPEKRGRGRPKKMLLLPSPPGRRHSTDGLSMQVEGAADRRNLRRSSVSATVDFVQVVPETRKGRGQQRKFSLEGEHHQVGKSTEVHADHALLASQQSDTKTVKDTGAEKSELTTSLSQNSRSLPSVTQAAVPTVTQVALPSVTRSVTTLPMPMDSGKVVYVQCPTDRGEKSSVQTHALSVIKVMTPTGARYLVKKATVAPTEKTEPATAIAGSSQTLPAKSDSNQHVTPTENSIENKVKAEASVEIQGINDAKDSVTVSGSTENQRQNPARTDKKPSVETDIRETCGDASNQKHGEDSPGVVSKVLSPTGSTKYVPQTKVTLLTNTTEPVSTTPKTTSARIKLPTALSSTTSFTSSPKVMVSSPSPYSTHLRILPPGSSPGQPRVVKSASFRVVSPPPNIRAQSQTIFRPVSVASPLQHRPRILLPNTVRVKAVKTETVAPTVTPSVPATNVIDLNELISQQGFFDSWKGNVRENEESSDDDIIEIPSESSDDSEEKGRESSETNITPQESSSGPQVIIQSPAAPKVSPVAPRPVVTEVKQSVITTHGLQPVITSQAPRSVSKTVNIQQPHPAPTQPSAQTSPRTCSQKGSDTVSCSQIKAVTVTVNNRATTPDAAGVSRTSRSPLVTSGPELQSKARSQGKTPVIYKIIPNKGEQMPPVGQNKVVKTTEASGNTGVVPGTDPSGTTSPKTQTPLHVVKKIVKGNNDIGKTTKVITLQQSQSNSQGSPSPSTSILQEVFRRPLETSSVVKPHQQIQIQPNNPTVRNINIQDVSNTFYTNQPQLQEATSLTFMPSGQRQIEMATNCQNVLLPNNQFITVVSQDMSAIQAAPITVVSTPSLLNQGVSLMTPGTGILNQTALMQAGLIPNTNYLQQPVQPVQPVQLQTVNVLQPNPAILSTPSGLCLPQVSYVTSTPTFVQQSQVQQPLQPQVHKQQQQILQTAQEQQTEVRLLQQEQEQQSLQQNQQQLVQTQLVQQQGHVKKEQLQQQRPQLQELVQPQIQQNDQNYGQPSRKQELHAEQVQQLQELQQQHQNMQQEKTPHTIQVQQVQHKIQPQKQLQLEQQKLDQSQKEAQQYQGRTPKQLLPQQQHIHQHQQQSRQHQQQEQKHHEYHLNEPQFAVPTVSPIKSPRPSPSAKVSSLNSSTRGIRVSTPSSTITPTNSMAQTKSLLSSLFNTPLPEMSSGTSGTFLTGSPGKHSRSDQIIMEELTGKKIDIAGDALDSAATSILSMLINEKMGKTGNNSAQPMRSILSTKPTNPVTSLTSNNQVIPSIIKQKDGTASMEVKSASGGTDKHTVQIERQQDKSGPLIRLETTTEEECFRDGPTDKDKKVRYKKIIRKKIIIRKGGLYKRKLGESSTGSTPPSKKQCLIVDKNGVVHGHINNLVPSGAKSGTTLDKEGQENRREEQPKQTSSHFPFSLKSIQSSLHEKRKKFKLPIRKYNRGHSRFKINPKLLKVGHSKENQKDVISEVLQRKRARKQAMQERRDIEEQQSHLVIHPHLQHPMLPQPELEEEVIAVAATSEDEAEPRRHKHKKDGPHLVYEITSDDGFQVRCDSSHEAWKAVTDQVQDARANARMKQLSYTGVNGLAMFGLVQDAVTYLVEQLYGAQHCTNYRFRYHDYRNIYDEEVPENPSGAARCQPFHMRKHRDMFSFLLSKYRPLPTIETVQKDEDLALKSQRRATSMELPMAMRFRHLRLHAKEAIGVYRSPIHGRGLFCKRDIDAGEMIVEYAGQVIRSMVTDIREKYYESKGIGCYMFRIDEGEVVDATTHGNAARFINHCCEPNCYSRVITIDNKKHIVIFALRPIKKGEELTYDYKFPIEEVKIPCTCNAKRCRKYLN